MKLLSLKWNNHGTTFFDVLTNIREKESYADVTLACQGKFFPVHRLVLATCSDYFSEVFEKTTCKAPVVIMNGIELNHLEYLLDYMYLGIVDVPQAELASLIKAAEGLQIKGLAVPDEEPSTSKRPADSEQTHQSKRSKLKASRNRSPASPKSEPETPTAEHESTHVFPRDTIKLEDEEPPPSPPSVPKQELQRGQDHFENVNTYQQEEFDFQETSNPEEGYSEARIDPANFLDDSAGLSWEDENSGNSQQSRNFTKVEDDLNRRFDSKKQRKAINLETKIKIINDYEEGKTVNRIARDHGLAHSTISTIIKGKDRWKEAAKEATGSHSIILRRQKGVIHEMEKQLAVWLEDQIQQGMPMSILSIQKKARSIYSALKERAQESNEIFTASYGWFHRFRRRYPLLGRDVGGELVNMEEDQEI